LLTVRPSDSPEALFRGGGRFLLRGAVLGLLVVFALGLGAGTAVAGTLTTTSATLPGSFFQGGDGDQLNAPGLIDWEGLEADGRVVHTVDPNAQDNIFGPGAKELEPDGWSWATKSNGADPKGANITDVYRAVDPAPPQGGDAFLYLAWVREADSGSQALVLELNQDARLWRNSTGTMVPCRKTGDILISFLKVGNFLRPTHGVSVQVDRWVTDPGAADPATGCARSGTLDPAAGLVPNVDVQGSWNGSDIDNFLPISLLVTGFSGTSTIAESQFGESAVDLTTWLSDLGNPCGVVASAWAHSRASDTLESDMKDYVAPGSFRVSKACTALTSSASGVVFPNARGRHRLRRHIRASPSASIYDTATLTGGDDPTGTITFDLYGPDNAGCTGAPIFTDPETVTGNGSYQSGAFQLTAAGTYRWVVEYSGDANNRSAGPTACGANSETVVVTKATPTLSSTASGGMLQPAGTPRRGRARGAPRRTARAPQEIFDTADLEGGIAPSGTITFRLYGPDNASCAGDPIFRSVVRVQGNGAYNSDPFTPTVAGTYRWRVSYSGDANNQPAGPTACGDPSETVLITPAHPAIETVASDATVLGKPISDSATLSGGSHPTGTITFRVYGPDGSACAGNPADASSADVSGNGTYHSGLFTPTAVGTYRWVANYSGDHNNDPAATGCGDPGEGVVVSHGPPPPAPDLSSTASPSPPTPAGSPIYDIAHLSGGSQPTGTITFSVYGPNNSDCSAPPATLPSSVTVSGAGDYRSAPFTPTAPGTYRWVARYSGDEHNAPVATACSESAETVAVTKAGPALHTLALPVVPIGGQARDAAFLAHGAGPHGTITFRLYGPNDSTCTAPPVFTTDQNVIGNGIYVSSKFAPRQAGTYRWVATYSGDANNDPATTTCRADGEDVVVVARRPLLTTSASPPANVHRGSRGRAAGLSIYDSARLRFGFAPTELITFKLYGPNDATCSGPEIFTTATVVNGNGVYDSQSFTPTVSGTYRWVASYAGDTNNLPAGPTRCGETSEQVQVTVPADPQLITSASEAVPLGGAIHDTAFLSGGETPAGTITFRLYTPGDRTCIGSPAFTSTVTVNGNGPYVSASFIPAAAGAYRWAASYSGDARNHPAGTTCGDPAETVVVRPPSIPAAVPAFSTTSSQPPDLGTPIYDTAHLRGAIDPGGAITFELFGPDDQTCAAAPVFATTVAVTGNGDYQSPTLVVPQPGTYRWVAMYSGDAMNTPAGPTACGDSAETATVKPILGENADTGPNVPTPPKPKPKPPPPPPPPPTAGLG
jgi:hypothetical protein